MILLPNYKGKTKLATILVYLFFIVVCTHYILMLYVKRYKTFFEMKDAKFKLPNLSLCFPLYMHVEFNCSSIEEKQLRTGCVKFFKLYDYYNDIEIKDKTPESTLKLASDLNLNESYTVSDNYEFEAYYLNFNYLCMKYTNKIKGEEPEAYDHENYDIYALHDNSITVKNNFRLITCIFFHEENFLYFFYRYFHIQVCTPFKNCNHFQFEIEQYKFRFLKEPWGSKCVDYEKLKYNYSNHIENEEIGLIECLKEKYPISLLFASLNDTRPFIYLPTNYASTPTLRRIPKSPTFKNCLKKFSRKDCSSSIHMNVNQKHFHKEYLNFTFKDRTILIEENIFLSSLDFCLQVLGFISLIFGISLHSSLSFLNFFITPVYNPKATVSNLIFCFKYFIVFIFLAHTISTTFQLANDFRNQTLYQVTYFNYFFQQKTINVYICFPIALAVEGLNASHKEAYELKTLTDKLLREHRLSELVSKGVHPSELMERIYLTDGLDCTDVDADKFAFKAFLMSDYKDGESIHSIYSKCFVYPIQMNLSTYQKLFKSTSLKIKFKVNYTSFYFVSFNQRITENDDQLHPTDCIGRYVTQRNQYECRDYHRIKIDDTVSLTQQGAIDLCTIRKFVDEFDHLPLTVPIHQVSFERYANSKFTSNQTDVEQVKQFKDNHFLEFRKKCKKKFKERNCEMVEYRSTGKKVSVSKEKNKISFDMFFLNQTYRPRECSNLVAFISNMLTLWSCFIDISIPTMIPGIFRLIMNIVKFRFKKDAKIFTNRNSSYSADANQQQQFRFSPYLGLIKKSFIFILFFVSLVIILFDTFLTIPVQSIGYDFKRNMYNFPTVGFCFDIVLNESERAVLTGNQLDILTSHLNLTNFLDRVEYIGKDDQNATWIINENDLDQNIYIDYFYYLDKKCFAFKYDLDTTSWNHMLIDYALKIQFKPNVTFNYIYYFTKAKSEESFSQFHRLKSNKNYLYSIKFECMRVIYTDILAKFKNPLILLTDRYNTEDSEYIITLKKWFEQATNLTTVYLPLRRSSFNLTIDNDKFREYYRTKVEPYERYFHYVNHERVVCKDFIVKTKSLNIKSLGFFISKGMIETVSKTENKVSYVSFFNSILNLLALFYNLSIIATTLDFINALLKLGHKIKSNLLNKTRILIKNRSNWFKKLKRNSIHSLNSFSSETF